MHTFSFCVNEQFYNVDPKKLMPHVKNTIEICKKLNVSLNRVAYIGDGLVDIPAFEIVSCPISVPNAHIAVK